MAVYVEEKWKAQAEHSGPFFSKPLRKFIVFFIIFLTFWPIVFYIFIFTLGGHQLLFSILLLAETAK